MCMQCSLCVELSDTQRRSPAPCCVRMELFCYKLSPGLVETLLLSLTLIVEAFNDLLHISASVQ